VLIDRNDLPKHLFGIPDLDVSDDLCGERLAGPWFMLGACGTGPAGSGSPFSDMLVAPALRDIAPLYRDLRCCSIDLAQIIRCEVDGCRADVLLHTRQLGATWDRNNPRLLGEQPRERDLSGYRLLPFRDCGQQVNQGLIGLPGLYCLKRGMRLRRSVLSNVVPSLIFPVRSPFPRGL